jgi:hypothetical protein
MPVWLRALALLTPVAFLAVPITEMAIRGQRGWWWWLLVALGLVTLVGEVVVFRQQRRADRQHDR